MRVRFLKSLRITLLAIRIGKFTTEQILTQLVLALCCDVWMPYISIDQSDEEAEAMLDSVFLQLLKRQLLT